MALEGFTLGLEDERYFPPIGGYMEAWCGRMPNNHVIAIFNRTRDNPLYGKQFILTVRKNIPAYAQTRNDFFRMPNGSSYYMQEFDELDPLTLKCIAYEGIPTEVT